MKIKVIGVLVLFVFMMSCKNETCTGLEFKDGVTYQYGKLFTGICNTYKNGHLRSTQEYLNGLDNSQWTFYFSDGQIQTEGVFEKGKRIGVWEYYHENGALKQKSNYKNGLKEGEWEEFSDNGYKVKSMFYKNDTLIKEVIN
jgi:antitoxin component YwqK of YwqJK toxin-antitoxin module